MVVRIESRRGGGGRDKQVEGRPIWVFERGKREDGGKECVKGEGVRAGGRQP